MAKVTGFGGLFFKTEDPAATAAWFTNKLGLPTESWGHVFRGREGVDTVLGLHKQDSDHFGSSTQPFMMNLHVDDLEGMLTTLEERGVKILKRMPPDEYGHFAHIEGPNGITIELWQAAKA